jgi:signal transduction histidine kinase
MTVSLRLKPIRSNLYQRWLQPKSRGQDSRRRELILNILLGSLTIISLIALAASLVGHILIDSQNGMTGLIFIAGFCALIGGLYYVSRRGHYQIGGYALVALIWFTATLMAIQWSIELTEAELVYTLAIVIAAVVLSSRAGLGIAFLTILIIIGVSCGQTYNLTHPNLTWASDLNQPDDVVGFVVIFAIIGLVSWLSNRETDQSLKRARASEAALTAERDNLDTAVKERTRQLEQTQTERIMELQRFAEFGRLTSGLLHDLANPLTTASLSLELIDTDKRSHLVRQAQKNVQHLERYVKAARRQIQSESQIRTFNTKTELSQAVSILERRAKLAKVTIELPSNQLRLHGDPVKFNQLATNLIANAIDAYVEQAKDVPSTVVKVEVDRAEDGIVLSVTDWGSGVKPTALKHIFQPFYSTKSNRGTGLGLAMVKDIVENDFHGKITVTSSAETGTRFVAELHNATKVAPPA